MSVLKFWFNSTLYAPPPAAWALNPRASLKMPASQPCKPLAHQEPVDIFPWQWRQLLQHSSFLETYGL